MSEIRLPGFPGGGRGGRDRGGYNAGAPWNRRPARRDMDIVDKELNRYQPAFDHVQRYPEGYGGQPRRGGPGFGGGRRRGGDGWLADDNKFDRFIGAIEGLTGKGGGNITNTFNPTFNPTNVNAGRDIRDTSIIGGGPNTAGRDITGAGGDVKTGDGGGNNTVVGGPGGTTTPPVDTTPPGDDSTPPGDDSTPPGDDTNKYDTFINETYNELLGRDAGEEGKTYWSGDLEGGQTEQQVIDNIKRSDEYLGRETFKDLASSMEGKTYDKDDATTGGSIDSNINEASLDAWIGPGGTLTQSSDADAAGYYEGVGDKEKAAELLYKPVATGDEVVATGWQSDLSERDEKIYDLYTDVMGRNPDTEGLKYWTGAGGEGMSLADIEASFKGSAEAKGRDEIGGTSNYQSIDDYVAGKNNTNTGGGNTTITQVGGGNNDSGVTTTGQDNTLTHSSTTSQSADDYLNAYANLTATDDNPAANTVSQTKAVTDTTTSGAIANQQKNTVDNWLTDLYSDLGINDGVVDQGGRDYWTEQLGNKSKAEVERDIKYAAGLG